MGLLACFVNGPVGDPGPKRDYEREAEELQREKDRLLQKDILVTAAQGRIPTTAQHQVILLFLLPVDVNVKV